MRSLTLSLPVLAGIILLCAQPASAFPAPPVLIDSGIDYAPAPPGQRYPSAAFAGGNWLVVWEDQRGGNRTAIWGARFSSSGVLLDSGNICIADDQEERTAPHVASNGFCFLVVWQDARNHSYDIYGTRVSPDGTVLDPNGFMISRSNETDEYPSVASNGAAFLVAWQDSRNPSNDKDIYAARVTDAGVVLDTVNIAVSTAPAVQEYPAVSGSSTGYLVTWQDWRNEVSTGEDIYACRVNTSGHALDPAGFPVSTAPEMQCYPQASSDGTNWLVTWEDYRNPDGDVFGARVTIDGSVLDPSGLAIHNSASYWQGDASVAYTGSEYLVAWEDDSLTGGYECDLVASRVTTAGNVLDPAGIVLDAAFGNQYYPCLALGSSNLLLTWQDYRTGGEDPSIYAAQVTLSGARLDTVDRLLSRQLDIYEQFTPAAAFDGTNFLTVWADAGRAGPAGWGQRVRGARISQSGAVLDPGGFKIATLTSSVSAPAVSYGTGNYLVAWSNEGGSFGLWAARVTPGGTVLDTNPIYCRMGGNEGGPCAVAFDGTNWLVVEAFLDYAGLANVQCVRIAQNGTLLDSTPIRVAYIPRRGLEMPAVAFGTNSYLVAWQDARDGISYNIYGARVSTDGTILDTMIPISTATRSQYVPAIAFDGTNWLVAWQDGRDGSNDDYYFARVTQSGAVLDPEGVRLGLCLDNYQDAAQLAFDGTNYFAVWQYSSYSNGDLWGARVSPAGAVLDTFTVCTAPEYQATPAIALGGGHILVSYSGWLATLRGYTAEKMRIWAGIYPFDAIAEQPGPVNPVSRVPTIVRGSLVLPAALCPTPGSRAVLLDASGREVLDLRSGSNNVQGLASGVYFIRVEQERSTRACARVVLTR